MISAWLASRFGPWIAGAALLVVLAGGAFWYRHSLIDEGVALESVRRDAIDVANAARAQTALMALNVRVLAAQSQLTAARLDLQKLQQENDREKFISSQRQSDLLAGRERMRVLTRPGNPAQTGSTGGAAVVDVDQGAGVVADLDPAVAAGIDAIRERHNEAVRRLAACVAEYDVLQAAVNAQ